MKNTIFSTLCFLVFFSQVKAQEFTIYFQKNRYNLERLGDINYDYYQFLGYAYVDRHNKGIVDHESVIKRIKELYPKKDDVGFLSLDIENKLYTDLRSKSPSVRRASVNEFIKIVDVIKELRPNVKIGVYGIPLRFNYEFQKKQNYFDELRPLLERVDYLSPDIYFSFSEAEQNEKNYVKNLEDNLTLFMDWASRVNKPLYPYVWYLIHPYNKKYGGKPISNDRMKLLLDKLKSFRYKGKGISGVLWWESWGTIQAESKENLTNRITPVAPYFQKTKK